jgi:hypothetical protein
MRKILFINLLVVLFAGVSSIASANLLNNPGFDTGDFTGWATWGTSEGGNAVAGAEISTQYKSSPNSAKLWAWGNTGEASAGIWQNFSVSEGNTYYINAYLKSLSSNEPLRDGADAWVALEWYGDSGSQIGSTIDSTHLNFANDAWQLFQISDTAPTGAVTGRILLRMYDPGLGQGDGRAVYFDDAYADITPIPEPASVVLLSTGIIGLMPFWYRRRNKE